MATSQRAHVGRRSRIVTVYTHTVSTIILTIRVSPRNNTVYINPPNAPRGQVTPVRDKPPPLFFSSRAISSAPLSAFLSLPTFDLRLRTLYRAAVPTRVRLASLFSSPLLPSLLASCSLPRFGRLLHLRKQHGSFDLRINPSHLDFDDFSLNPHGTRLCRTNSQRVDTKLRAYTTVVLST